MSFKPLFLTSLATLPLLACVDQTETMVRQGYPLAYAEGFQDGCHSGKKAGGSMFDQFRKDIQRFDTDHKYAQGWSDGFRQCESEQEALERQTRMYTEQQRLYEQQKHDRREEKHYLQTEVLKGVDGKALERDLKKKYR
ncbi:hypothetical protein [Thiolapillus sp.]